MFHGSQALIDTPKQASGNVGWNSKSTCGFKQWHKPYTKKERNNAVKSIKIKLSKLAQILTYQDRKIPCKVIKNKCM